MTTFRNYTNGIYDTQIKCVLARYQREQAVNNAITSLKAANKATREAKEKEIAQEYRDAENEAWNDFINATMGVNAGYQTTVLSIEETHQVSVAEAKANFEQTMIPATTTYVNQTLSYREQFQQAADLSSQNTGFLNITRKPREWVADKVRGFLQWETKIAEDAAAYVTNNSPYAVGAVSFFGNLQQNVAGIGLSFVESEKTIEGIFVDVGEAIDVGNEHGVFVGVDHMIGLRQFSESYYGVDIMTFDKIDPLDKIADGSGRFGGTTGLFTGIAGGIRSWINPKPVNVATVLTENLQKNMKPNVAAEVTQQTAKPLVHSEVVAPKYPQGYTTTFDTSLFTNESANLASPKRTIHILTGDETGGGHLFPGMPGKTPFPKDWSPSKIMDVVSDIVTDPSSTIIQDTGILGTHYTRAGQPAKFFIYGTRDGIRIKIVVKPAGEGIITAYPEFE